MAPIRCPSTWFSIQRTWILKRYFQRRLALRMPIHHCMITMLEYKVIRDLPRRERFVSPLTMLECRTHLVRDYIQWKVAYLTYTIQQKPQNVNFMMYEMKIAGKLFASSQQDFFYKFSCMTPTMPKKAPKTTTLQLKTIVSVGKDPFDSYF